MFWEKLARAMDQKAWTWQQAMEAFGDYFTFKIAYTSIYQDGAYDIVVNALPLVGWQLVPIKSFKPSRRKEKHSGTAEIKEVGKEELEKLMAEIEQTREKEDYFGSLSEKNRKKLDDELRNTVPRERSKRQRKPTKRYGYEEQLDDVEMDDDEELPTGEERRKRRKKEEDDEE